MYKICVVGGWCGNRMAVVKDSVQRRLTEAGFPVKVTDHSVWENYTTPPIADLILQLLPAYKESEIGCPVINIKPLLLDADDPKIYQKIMDHVAGIFSNTTTINRNEIEQPHGSGLENP